MRNIDLMGIDPALKCLAGKSSEISGWLPLVVHCADTMGVMLHLLDDWLAKNTQEVIGNGLSHDDLRRLAAFIAFTHDIGKITP